MTVATIPLFIAAQRFDPSDGEKWTHYVNWAKIPTLREVVSLDSILRPPILDELLDEDWKHIVSEDYRLNYSYHLDYFLQRTLNVPPKNVLGLYRNPDTHIAIPPHPTGFQFEGYDLIEDMTQISALSNCGGFPLAFSNDELNPQCLILDFARAAQIQTDLRTTYPLENHANCEIYAIWRLHG